MSSPTTDPWTVNDGDPPGVLIVGGKRVRVSGWAIASDTVDEAIVYADADLISAAPELLAALEAVEWSGWDEYYGHCCAVCDGAAPGSVLRPRHIPGHTPDCIVAAAIAKAKGEAR